MTDSFASVEKMKASQAAYAAVDKLKPQTTSIVEYQSRGHVVVIGDSHAIETLGALPEDLTHEVIAFKGKNPSDDISISGALGKFVISVAGQEIKADIVLDLAVPAILSMELKPPGYVHANISSDNLDEIKAELAELVGTFEKPKYFNLNVSACAHGRSGKPGCTRCLDACPAEAITSLIDRIEVDPSRCQGGGVCAMVCPSGAITYAYPKPKDLLNHVRTLILTYLKEGGSPPDLFFVTENERTEVEQTQPAALIIVVEEVASVGSEIWLSALAWGAKSVRLFDLGNMPKSSRLALDQQIEMAQTLLVGANYPASSVLLVSDLADLISNSAMPPINATTHAAITGKREALYMAFDHLVAESEKKAALEPIVRLPEGSIFGQVQVNQDNCTLCMACVSACPANALQDGHEKPLLGFIEANCLQCNICVNTCPESAMSISPRFLLNREQRKKPQVLHEEPAFCCISCGKPFATQSGISGIIEKLSGHSMFADEGSLNRLKMCDDCRVKDMMEDPNSSFQM